ncbi:MAG: polyprenyl synthetase family protein [Clostridia bacterium]|nr:polyprenyl synthetase family protein [Clostridia bacterium]
MTISARLEANAALVEESLAALMAEEDADFASELAAERYSLFSRAKRIRPTLVLEFCRLFGGNDAAALPFAAAVEMVHTYSLIHDDLPCMDDDNLRRGKPTCHKAFGESTALLAGDGLLTRAFGALVTSPAPDGAVRAAVAALSRAAGSFGMIGGQVMDLDGEEKKLPMDKLLKLHAHKTGALISVSAELGCLAAGLSPSDRRTVAAKEFAKGIGLAFQIVDDVLDATADVATLGKSIGSDARAEKTTFLTYYSVEDALKYAAEVTERAKAAIADMAGSEFLCDLADALVKRSF